MPAKDVVIEGSFTINNYTVTYLVDGKQTGKQRPTSIIRKSL